MDFFFVSYKYIIRAYISQEAYAFLLFHLSFQSFSRGGLKIRLFGIR